MDMDADIYTELACIATRWKMRERVSEMLLIEISSVLFNECHFSRARLNQTRAKTNKTSKLIKQIIRKKSYRKN
jgi:hypothetical protein